MMNVDQAIRELGAVYQALTGRPIEAGRSELPPEVDPLAHVEGRYRQFKSMLDSGTRGQAPETAPPVAWSPALEVLELEREVRFVFDLPGVARQDVSVSIAGDHLAVRGQRVASAPTGATLRHSERPLGSFQRLVALPPRARRDGIEATLRDGVLVVAVPTDVAAAATAPIEVK
jgi:HSP20 family protein